MNEFVSEFFKICYKNAYSCPNIRIFKNNFLIDMNFESVRIPCKFYAMIF